MKRCEVQVIDTKVLGQGSYGTIQKCRILEQEPYVDPNIKYVVKYFQFTGLAKYEVFMLQEIKLVPFTNHPSIIKPFGAQLKPIHS